MNILERYHAMDYGPAPEARNEADAWLAARDFSQVAVHRRRVARGGRCEDLRHRRSLDRQAAGKGVGGGCCRHRRGGGRRAQGAAEMERRLRLRARQGALRHRPRHAAPPAPVRGARKPRQRQADPRKPRHRRAAGDPPFHPPCRLGPVARPRISRPQAGRRRRPDHPVEFSAADAGLEDRARARRRLHGGAEAGRVHAADGDPVRRDLRTRWRAQGRGQHRPWRTRGGRGDRQPSRHRQDRLHRLVRGRQDHPQGDRRLGQEAVAGARRQVGLHRLRGRRSRQRGRGAGRRHLVQPGPGLLRRLAPAGAGRRRRRLHRQGQGAHEPAARRQPARQEHRHRPAGRPQPARPRASAWSRRAPGRARSAGSRTATCPRPATITCRRWRPVLRRPTSLPRRRCSARCWPP